MTTPKPASTAELLKRLNSLLADVGSPPIKAWKGSRAALEAKIIKARDASQAKLDAKVEAADTPSGDLADHPVVKEARLNKKGKVVGGRKTKAEPKATASESFSLADLARELGVNPKVMRAKARRHASKLEKLRVGSEGWVFLPKHATEVRNILAAK